MDRSDRRILVVVAAGLMIVMSLAVANFVLRPPTTMTLSYSALLESIERGELVRVELLGPAVAAQRIDGSTFESFAPEVRDLVTRLVDAGVDVKALPAPETVPWQQTMLMLVSVLLLTVMMIVFMLRGSRGTTGIGKVKARRLDAQPSPVRFADVAGAAEAKQSLLEIVDFLRRPDRYRALGGRIPKGVLMVGPPGSGKTLLARAVSGEAGVPFYAVSGSDFVEVFVGVGASRVRSMFEAAKQTAPCIIFIDEIDAVGRHRGASMGQGNDEREQTLNQLLVEMDGIGGDQGVVVMAATNRPDVLDPALVRSGRFDREVVVDNPDRLARRQILEVHLRDVPMAEDVDIDALAQATPGLSGADLANLVNEAVLQAVRTDRQTVGRAELEQAKDKLTSGGERQAFLSSPQERRRVAYRVGASALLALRLPGAHPIEKASIIPRGRSGQYLVLLDPEVGAPTRSQLLGRLTLILAGRAAEKLVYGADEISTSTAPGLAEATELARDMVMRWGMSDSVGAVSFAKSDDGGYLASSAFRVDGMSEEDAWQVSSAVRRLLEDALADATNRLTVERTLLETLTQSLYERETLSGAEIKAIADGQFLAIRHMA